MIRFPWERKVWGFVVIGEVYIIMDWLI